VFDDGAQAADGLRAREMVGKEICFQSLQAGAFELFAL